MVKSPYYEARAKQDALDHPVLEAPVPDEYAGASLARKTLKESAFLIFALFCGDIPRTAHAMNVEPVIIEGLAREHDWDAKLRPIVELKQSTRPGDIERAMNRAVNFVQAHRWRSFLEAVMGELTGMSPKKLKAHIFVTETDKSGVRHNKISTRPLADLSAAIEKCHALTYLALNDTATERKDRDDNEEGQGAAAELHLRLADAMAKAAGPATTMRGMLAETQLEIASTVASKTLDAPLVGKVPSLVDQAHGRT
jgi:hypothetical protein